MNQTDIIKSLIKKNIIWVAFVLILVISFATKNQEITIPVTTNPDTEIILSNSDILEQTWQANLKIVTGLSIPFVAEENQKFSLQVQVIDEKTGEILTQQDIKQENQNLSEQEININFVPIKVNIGERYILRLTYYTESKGKTIVLEADSEGFGCQLNDKKAACAASIDIVGIKTRNLSWIILVFTPFILCSFLFMVLWKRKWEEAIGVSVIAITTVIVLAGLLGNLEWGVYIAYLASIVCGCIGIYLYNKKQMNIKDIISPGLFVYGLLVMFVLINCSDLYVAWYDDFSHWGLAVKDMFVYDKIGKHSESILTHVYYPPFMSVIEYYFVYMNGFYVDKFLYIAYQIVIISCLSIVYKAAEKKVYMIVPATIAMLAGLITFYNAAFSTLYVDAILAVFVAYTLICYFTGKSEIFDWIRVFFGLLALTYTKPTGVVLAGLITLIIIADTFFEWKKKIEVKQLLRKLLVPCISTIFVCILFVGWQVYLKMPVKGNDDEQAVAVSMQTNQEEIGENTESKAWVLEQEIQKKQEKNKPAKTTDIISASRMDLSKIMDFFQGEGPEYQYETIRAFIEKITSGAYIKHKTSSVSYVYVFTIVIIVGIIWSLFVLDQEKKKKMLRFTIFSSVAGGIYTLFLLFTYLFTFSAQEAVGVAHYERYISSWICGMVIALFAIILIRSGNEKDFYSKKVMIITAVLLICLYKVTPTEKLEERRSDKIFMEDFYINNEQLMERVRQTGAKNEQYIYLCNSDTCVDYWKYQYLLCPVKVKSVKKDEVEKSGIYKVYETAQGSVEEYIDETYFLTQ